MELLDMKPMISAIIIRTVSVVAVALPIALNAQNLPSGGSASCYSSLLSGPPPTLFVNIQSIDSDGTVVVNGGDTAQPTTPFQWAWGDGSRTSGFFPQQHVYANTSQNYLLTIIATENNGTTQQFSFPVFFLAPPITPQFLAGISFQIPSQAVTLQTHWPYSPPTDVQPFLDSSFPTYSRSDLAYILAAIASIDYSFANENSFLLNGVFSMDMFELTDSGGGESFWYTTPMSVGYGPTVVAPSPQWSILFNEIGKDATLNTPQSLTFGGNTDGNASEIYSETMGDIFSYASGCQLISNASAYGIGADVKQDIQNSLLSGAAALQASFNAYVAAGAPFSSWNPYNGGADPTLGTISTLAWKFIEHAELQGLGYATPITRLMRLLQMFDSSLLASYAPHDNTEAAATFRSTLMVAALSYAFSADLRNEFEALNFPIDDGVFERLYQMASGLTGVGIYRSSNGLFLLNSQFNNMFTTADTVTLFAGGGLTPESSDIPVAGDWSGTGTTKIGLYRPTTGTWFLDWNGNGVYDGPMIDRQYQYGGVAGDIPVVGDWNGTGSSKVGIFRAGFLFLLNTSGSGVFSSSDQVFAFGGLTGCVGSLPSFYSTEPARSCDIPIVGDWNQTGTTKVGIVRAAPGTSQPFLWILDTSGAQRIIVPGPGVANASTVFAFGGILGDVPVVGHWNGSLGTQVGVFRDGFLWVEDTTANLPTPPAATDTLAAFPYGGVPGDEPIVGHW